MDCTEQDLRRAGVSLYQSVENSRKTRNDTERHCWLLQTDNRREPNNIQNVLLWLECGHGDVCAIVNNTLLHSNSHVNQMPPQISHTLSFRLVDSLPQIL